MPKRIGVWIDHAQAHLVSLANATQPHVVTIASEIEHKHKAMPRAGRVAPGHLSSSPIKRYEQRRVEKKRRYYGQIVKALAGAEQIVVMGPGFAKGELQKEIKRDVKLKERLNSIEPADKKMTNAQLIAKVRKAFNESPLRGFPKRGTGNQLPQKLDRISGRDNLEYRAEKGLFGIGD